MTTWNKIIFCKGDCGQLSHIYIGLKPVCNQLTLPKQTGEYLVSDGKNIGISNFHISFRNFEAPRKILNEKIKYWSSLDDVQLPLLESK